MWATFYVTWWMWGIINLTTIMYVSSLVKHTHSIPVHPTHTHVTVHATLTFPPFENTIFCDDTVLLVYFFFKYSVLRCSVISGTSVVDM